MVNKKILKIRKSLDKLDNQFLQIIKKRTILVDKITQKIWSSMIKAYIDYEFRKFKKK